jgi:hypothetical protein
MSCDRSSNFTLVALAPDELKACMELAIAKIALHIDRTWLAAMGQPHDRVLSCRARRRSTSAARSFRGSATSTGQVFPGSSRRKGSGSRSRLRAVRARIWASVDAGARRRPLVITGPSRGSPGRSSSSTDRISCDMWPSGPYRRHTCLRPGQVALPVDRLRRGRPAYSCSL